MSQTAGNTCAHAQAAALLGRSAARACHPGLLGGVARHAKSRLRAPVGVLQVRPKVEEPLQPLNPRSSLRCAGLLCAHARKCLRAARLSCQGDAYRRKCAAVAAWNEATLKNVVEQVKLGHRKCNPCENDAAINSIKGDTASLAALKSEFKRLRSEQQKAAHAATAAAKKAGQAPPAASPSTALALPAPPAPPRADAGRPLAILPPDAHAAPSAEEAEGSARAEIYSVLEVGEGAEAVPAAAVMREQHDNHEGDKFDVWVRARTQARLLAVACVATPASRRCSARAVHSGAQVTAITWAGRDAPVPGMPGKIWKDLINALDKRKRLLLRGVPVSTVMAARLPDGAEVRPLAAPPAGRMRGVTLPPSSHTTPSTGWPVQERHELLHKRETGARHSGEAEGGGRSAGCGGGCGVGCGVGGGEGCGEGCTTRPLRRDGRGGVCAGRVPN